MDRQCIYLKPSSGLSFPGIDYLREKINRALIATDFKFPVILDCSRVSTLDYTSLKGVQSLIKDLKKQNQTLTLINLDDKLMKKLDEISK